MLRLFLSKVVDHLLGERMDKVVTMFLAAVLATMVFVLAPGVVGAQSAAGEQNEETSEGKAGQEAAVAEATFEEPLSV